VARTISLNTPPLRLHKHSGQGYVIVGGHRRYLGKYGLPETLEQYRRLCAEWLAGSLDAVQDRPREITVSQLCAAFWKHAQKHYVLPDGRQSHELGSYAVVIRATRALYGSLPVSRFGPKALKAVRETLIGGTAPKMRRPGSRKTINKHVGRIRRIFKWGVAEEMVPETAYRALLAVDGLQQGKSEARESRPVQPVPEAHIEAVQPLVSRQVNAMIELQLLTAMRPGEACMMRPCDLDVSGKVWIYRPKRHKTEIYGHERVVYLGPRAQQIVRPFLAGRGTTDYLFSAKEAEADRLAARHAKRKTPPSLGNRPGTNRRETALRTPGDHYTSNSYRRCIQRACKTAGVPVWRPHRLRHTAATRFREQAGLDVAQTLLGHRVGSQITEIYAQANVERALQVITKVG
jgi:integrase